MLRRLAPLLLGLAACAPLPPASLSHTDQESFGSFRHPPGTLAVPINHEGRIDAAVLLHRDGVEYRTGDYDLDALPNLREAWRSGRIPRYGMLGEVGGARLSGLAVETRLDQAGSMHVYVVARTLRPFPFEMLCEVRAGETWNPLGTVQSTRWGPGVYYARVERDIADLLLVWQGLRATVTEQGSGWSLVTEAALVPAW